MRSFLWLVHLWSLFYSWGQLCTGGVPRLASDQGWAGEKATVARPAMEGADTSGHCHCWHSTTMQFTTSPPLLFLASPPLQWTGRGLLGPAGQGERWGLGGRWPLASLGRGHILHHPPPVGSLSQPWGCEEGLWEVGQLGEVGFGNILTTRGQLLY